MSFIERTLVSTEHYPSFGLSMRSQRAIILRSMAWLISPNILNDGFWRMISADRPKTLQELLQAMCETKRLRAAITREEFAARQHARRRSLPSPVFIARERR
jgi:hypothetical protein